MGSYQLFKRTRNIRSAARQMKPDDLWVKQTRETLLMQVKNSQPAKPEGQSVINKIFNIFVPVVSFRWMRAPVAIIAVVIMVLFGGVFFSVSASERALPGDFLYSIKLVTEQARIALAEEPNEKIKLKTEFTKRRMDEMKQVLASSLPDKNNRVQEAAKTLKRDMDTIKNQFEEVEKGSTPEEVKTTANLLDKQVDILISDLQESKISLSAVDKIKLSEVQAAASETSLTVIEVLLKTHFEDANAVSQQELLDYLKQYNIQVTERVARSIKEQEHKAVQSENKNSDAINNKATSSEAVNNVSSTPDVITNEPDTSDSDTDTNADAETDNQTADKADKPDTDQSTENKNPQEELDRAMESFAKADKLATEKELDKAVAMLKLGTEQAYAAQKIIEENEVQEALSAAKEAEANDTEEQEESEDDVNNTQTESVENPDQSQETDSAETEEQTDSESISQEPAESTNKEATSTKQESAEETDPNQSQTNP